MGILFSSVGTFLLKSPTVRRTLSRHPKRQLVVVEHIYGRCVIVLVRFYRFLQRSQLCSVGSLIDPIHRKWSSDEGVGSSARGRGRSLRPRLVDPPAACIVDGPALRTSSTRRERKRGPTVGVGPFAEGKRRLL